MNSLSVQTPLAALGARTGRSKAADGNTTAALAHRVPIVAGRQIGKTETGFRICPYELSTCPVVSEGRG